MFFYRKNIIQRRINALSVTVTYSNTVCMIFADKFYTLIRYSF